MSDRPSSTLGRMRRMPNPNEQVTTLADTLAALQRQNGQALELVLLNLQGQIAVLERIAEGITTLATALRPEPNPFSVEGMGDKGPGDGSRFPDSFPDTRPPFLGE